MRVKLIAIAGVFLCAAAAPVAAQTAAPTTAPAAKGSTLDPNKVICEKQEVVGSRLATRRVCMTRSQWADLRNQDRQQLDKVQTRRAMSGQ